MAQVYKMKHNPQGTIYSLLTVESDGQMTMTFHGTDREICHEVTENADGWLCYPGAMFPGLESGKWNKMDDGRCKMEDVVETTDNTDCTDNEVCVPATVEPIMADSPQLETSGYSSSTELEQLRAENQRLQGQIAQMAAEPYRGQSPCNPPSATHTGDSPREPRPRRQRKPRKPRVERREPLTINPEPLTVNHQTSSTLKAIGMVAAATVALLVIYETGLLIPLGLIGLATGGILK